MPRRTKNATTSLKTPPGVGISELLGVCIVCGSKLLLRIWRGHPDNAKIHCNDCGSEIPLYLHNQRLVRRWRSARPHCGGWWEWMEGGRGRVEKLLLCEGGEEVASDREWEEETGKPAEHDGWVENYWESTATTQKMMPGLWRQCPPNVKLCDGGAKTP